MMQKSLQIIGNINKYKSYPFYRDSGVERIGEIPSGWDSIPIKYILEKNKESIRTGPFGSQLKSDDMVDDGIKIYNQRTVYNEDFTKGEIYVTLGKYDTMKGFTVLNGDILISSRGTIGKMAIVPDGAEIGVLHPCLIRLRVDTNYLYKRYLWWYMNHSSLFLESVKYESNSTTIDVIYSNVLTEIRFPLPPLPEQKQIVSFLDHKIQKIDELIEKTEQKIELLKEKRTSLINHCVTKGLDPNVKMKDSGVEWIGEIPSGWEVKRLKYFNDVFSSSVDRHIYEDELQVSVCHYPDVYNNEFINEDIELNKGSCSEVEFDSFHLIKGLVILTKDSESPDDIGIPCYVETNMKNVVCGYHLSIIKKNEDYINSKFLFRFIQSDIVRCHFEIHSKGITRFSLGKSIIENLFVNLPPLPEQHQIVEYLDKQTQKIDSTIENETQRIELLKEYRQSLISEVVTGKIDVRDEVVV